MKRQIYMLLIPLHPIYSLSSFIMSKLNLYKLEQGNKKIKSIQRFQVSTTWKL